jgi:phosphoglycolate phosphatase-like HAD superfamily hydrolase
MARAARVYSVAVTGGYPNREALLASKPDAYTESIGALLEVIDGFSRAFARSNNR